MKLSIFSTCPPSNRVAAGDYLRSVVKVAGWSEHYGCEGILVYTDNGLVDPWMLAQVIVENTRTLSPLVAVQPVYMHPYTVAKIVTSFACLHNRRLYLNMLAGGFKNDLAALNDETPHDERYDRTRECTQVIMSLLTTAGRVSFAGSYYIVDNLELTPPMKRELVPGVFFSGSAAAGLGAARAVGATAVRYPMPARDYREEPLESDLPSGIRVGIIAREEEAEAWHIAHQRFPVDRRGQVAHRMAMKVSDSEWHKQLSELARDAEAGRSPYWLVPFETYKTFCPYLVGAHETVAAELAGYIAAGFESFILDVPVAEDDLRHTALVFEQAQGLLQHAARGDEPSVGASTVARP